MKGDKSKEAVSKLQAAGCQWTNGGLSNPAWYYDGEYLGTYNLTAYSQLKKRALDLLIKQRSRHRQYEPSRTEQQIIDDCNVLAREFYKVHGYDVPEGFKFHESSHPQEQSMWNLAVMAYEHVQGTDVLDALSQVEEVTQ